MPTVRPPATLAEVDAAEAALGFPLPLLLRRLYLEIGNGGFGPAYGLDGVPSSPPAPASGDIVLLYTELRSAPPPDENPSWHWPVGLVPLIAQGGEIWECVDFLNPRKATTFRRRARWCGICKVKHAPAPANPATGSG